jgi:hypothetical protein
MFYIEVCGDETISIDTSSPSSYQTGVLAYQNQGSEIIDLS